MIQEAVQMEPPTTTEIAIPDPSCTCGKAITKDMLFPRIVGGVKTKVSCTNQSIQIILSCLIVCEADLYILMLYVSQLVSVPCSKSN